MKKSFLLLLISTMFYCSSLHKLPSDVNPVGLKDEKTGLIWQKCKAGNNQQTCRWSDELDEICKGKIGGDFENCADQYLIHTWKQAVAYCDSFGGNWRLPTVSELLSLYDFSNGRSKVIGPIKGASDFWTSDSYEFDSSKAWILENDYPTLKYKKKRYQVRCVSN